MAYDKTTWVSGSAPGIDADKLNNLESQYDEVKAELTKTDGDISVDGANLVEDSVATDSLADDAVTTAKIADAAVDTAQLADGAVSAAKTTGIARMASGTYNGDGTTGRVISVGFTPKMVIVGHRFGGGLNNGDAAQVWTVLNGNTDGSIEHQGDSTSSTYRHRLMSIVRITTNGFIVDDFGDYVYNSPNFNFVAHQLAYDWVAFG